MGPAARSAQKCRTGAEAINAQLWMMVNFKRFTLRCQAIYSGAFHKICRHGSVESSRAERLKQEIDRRRPRAWLEEAAALSHVARA
jgi:hypothetical protein